MKLITKACIAALCCYWVPSALAVDPELSTPPSIENMRYGKYEQNIMDLYLVDSETPTPIAIFIHGGGFKSGTKEQVNDTVVMEELLAAGISVASIDYRLTLEKEVTLGEILHEDMTLAVQVLRHRASSLNIDPTRMAAWGNSAGAGAALFLGVADDIADSDNVNPILRQSSKVQVVGHLAGQSTYDVVQWADIAGVRTDWMELTDFEDDLFWFNVESRDQITPEMRAKVDITALISSDDAIIYAEKTPDRIDPVTIDEDISEDDKPIARVQVAHSKEHAIFIGTRCSEAGITCEIVTEILPGPKRELFDFFIEHLLP